MVEQVSLKCRIILLNNEYNCYQKLIENLSSSILQIEKHLQEMEIVIQESKRISKRTDIKRIRGGKRYKYFKISEGTIDYSVNELEIIGGIIIQAESNLLFSPNQFSLFNKTVNNWYIKLKELNKLLIIELNAIKDIRDDVGIERITSMENLLVLERQNDDSKMELPDSHKSISEASISDGNKVIATHNNDKNDSDNKKKSNPNKGITKRIKDLIKEYKPNESDKGTAFFCDKFVDILKGENFKPVWGNVYKMMNREGINDIDKKRK